MIALLTTTTTATTHYLIVEGRVLIFEDRLGLSRLALGLGLGLVTLRLAHAAVTVLSRSVGAVAGHLGSGVGSRVRVRASGQWEGSG